MPLRNFDPSAQASPVQAVQAERSLSWVELDCPNCRRLSYVPERERRLNRTGSQQEYAACPWCAVPLTAGRVVKRLGRSGLRALFPWLLWFHGRAATFTRRNGGS